MLVMSLCTHSVAVVLDTPLKGVAVVDTWTVHSHTAHYAVTLRTLCTVTQSHSHAVTTHSHTHTKPCKLSASRLLTAVLSNSSSKMWWSLAPLPWWQRVSCSPLRPRDTLSQPKQTRKLQGCKGSKVVIPACPLLLHSPSVLPQNVGLY